MAPSAAKCRSLAGKGEHQWRPIGGMLKEHPHSAASYRVVIQMGVTFGVRCARKFLGADAEHCCGANSRNMDCRLNLRGSEERTSWFYAKNCETLRRRCSRTLESINFSAFHRNRLKAG